MNRYVIPFPFSLEQECEWLDRSARADDWIMWAVYADGEPIGSASIFTIDWRHRRGETGTLIGRAEYRGKGLGSELMRLRARYAFEELGLEKLVTHARADNVKSIHGLQRAGYRTVGTWRRHIYGGGQWHDVWLGELLREDWEAQQKGESA